MRATLLNDGRPVDFAVELVPSEHLDHKPYLRLRNLPANTSANTVLVVRLEFDRPLSQLGSGTFSADDIRVR